MNDLRWQRAFAASGVIFAILCGAGLEVFGPQPPAFDTSAAATARYYVVHHDAIMALVTLSALAMAFLLPWTIQLGVMLWKRPELSRTAVLVAIVSLVASPVLLSFDLTFFAIAAYRAGSISPDVTQALSDVAWIGSMLIWPQLGVGMAIVGVLLLRAGSMFPRWLGWYSIFCAVAEPFQAGIIFTTHGAFGPRGWTSWYGAVITWGIWVLALSIAMCRRLFTTDAGTKHDVRAPVGANA